MSEESKTNQVEETNATNPSTDASKNNDIPYSRFQEVNSAKKQAESLAEERLAKINEYEAEKKAKREEQMMKKEEYTTLIAEKDAEIEKYKATANKWNEYETNRRDALVSKLPENKQKFVSSMGLTDLEEFVDIETANLNKGTGMDSSRVGAKPQDSGEFGGYSSIEEFAMRDPKGCETYLANNTKGYIK